jgi:streptogramin lyase
MASAFGQRAPESSYTWAYHRPGNTGIQGDYCDAVWIGPDGDPWIGGYVPSFEEGGVAKFLQSENRWVNVSSVDHQVFGHPSETGSARIADIASDASGNLWMGTGHGALLFNPEAGPRSLKRFSSSNSALRNGWTTGVEVAADGSVWFSAYATAWGGGGLARYNPATHSWTRFDGYGEGSLAVQPRPGGGYYVWTLEAATSRAARWDSVSQSWTTYPIASGSPGRVIGKKATDGSGNTWMRRITDGYGNCVVGLRSPEGGWISVPQPPASPEALTAWGDRQALVAAGDVVYRFDGSAWTSLGRWGGGAWTSDLAIDASGNVWAVGTGGAAKRSATTGLWQRHRLTQNGNMDSFNNDVSVGADGTVFVCSNGAPGIGGIAKFDGSRWANWNQATYGLGFNWPFQSDNSAAVLARRNGRVVANPTHSGVHEWDGSAWRALGGPSTVVQFAEDSAGRLWAVGNYFDLRYHDGAAWVSVGITGWGSRVEADRARPGTVWASTQYEVKRTDGSYVFSRTVAHFPELTTQSDTFSGLAVDRDGSAWFGCTVRLGAGGSGGGLIKLNPATGAYQMWRYDQGWPFPGKFLTPLAVSPDGRLWMIYVNTYQYFDGGLCWFDGQRVGVFPGPAGGGAQWGGLPHTQIKRMVVKETAGGYELWMSCLSRGIAVLRVTRPSWGRAGRAD